MIDLEAFFKEKPLVPTWFKTHAICGEVKQVNKIFPAIGLTNFSVESNLGADNTAGIIKALLKEIGDNVYNIAYYFNLPNPGSHIAGVAGKPAAEVKTTASIMQQLIAQLKIPQQFVRRFKEKKGLYLHQDIVGAEKAIFAKSGESLFKVYGKLKTFLKADYKLDLASLEQGQAFKDFSANNFDGKMQVVFSSDGSDGAWDILTMSMRGISSCQAWTGQYRNCAIGSVLDPFTGIIYLTSGSKTQYGSKMIRRCIVRFVVDTQTKRPCIYLEYMYPSSNVATMRAFKDVIVAKIGAKFPVVINHVGSNNRYYVPYSQITGLLVKHSPNPINANIRGNHNIGTILPYRDTYIEYRNKEEASYDPPKLVAIMKRAKILETIKANLIGEKIDRLQATAVDNILKADVFEKVSSSNTKEYLRSACFNFFTNKKKIADTIIEKLKTLIPSAKKPSATKRAAAKAKKVVEETKPVEQDIAAIVNSQIMPLISKEFKATWKSAIGSGKTSAKKPSKTQPKADAN